MNWSSKEKNPHTFITSTDSLTLFFPKGYVKILLQRFSFVFLDGMFHPLRFLDATKFDSSLDSVKPFSLLFLYIYFIIDSCYASSWIIILKRFFVPLGASGVLFCRCQNALLCPDKIYGNACCNCNAIHAPDFDVVYCGSLMLGNACKVFRIFLYPKKFFF